MTTNTGANHKHDQDELQKCVFCKIVKKEIPSQIVFEDNEIIAFLDISPVNPGHTLVVPKEHHADILETPDALLGEMMTRVKKLAPAIIRAVRADGFNVGINTKPAAGQVIFHTHLHIIPRFSTDGLKHWSHQKLENAKMAELRDAISALLT